MLFSALDDAQSRLVRQGLHVDVVLAKPFGLADFEACIRRVQGRGESEPSDAQPALSEDESQVLGILRKAPGEANRSADIVRKLLDVGIAVTAEEVESCIDRLNRKLCARSSRVVRVRGLGYTLVDSAPSQSPLILE
jgi:DNA-binding response OmpR family regulator